MSWPESIKGVVFWGDELNVMELFAFNIPEWIYSTIMLTPAFPIRSAASLVLICPSSAICKDSSQTEAK